MKDNREKEIIEIEFNEDNLSRFLKEYYKTHRKKGKKTIIESPIARSMNKIITITNRIVQNTHKQNRGEYVKFVLRELGLEKLGINETDLKVEFVFPTRVRHDLDNVTAGLKEYLDSFTDLGVITDDDYLHIKSITSCARYEKGISKMIFKFMNCKYDKQAMEKAIEKERVRKEKREETLKQNKINKKKRGEK